MVMRKTWYDINKVTCLSMQDIQLYVARCFNPAIPCIDFTKDVVRLLNVLTWTVLFPFLVLTNSKNKKLHKRPHCSWKS